MFWLITITILVSFALVFLLLDDGDDGFRY